MASTVHGSGDPSRPHDALGPPDAVERLICVAETGGRGRPPNADGEDGVVVGGGCLAGAVSSWQEFSEQAPELAARVLERFEAHRHKTMATIRPDGGPRISGTEVPIKLGQVYLGGMTGNKRFADLRRDPRVAIHSASEDPDVWSRDAKLAGRAVEVTDEAEKAAFRGAAQEVPPGDFELFRVDITEAVVVRLSDERDHLLIDVWREGGPVRTHVRR